jgi:hypothetical protein
VFLIAAGQAQTSSKKAAADYGKEITLQMLPNRDDASTVQRQKCDHLATILVDPQYGNEDLTGMSEEVLANMRSNTICAGFALNDKDIDKLGTVLSLQTDVSNELLRRVATYAESEEKKYDKLQEDYKALLAYQLAHAPTQAASAITGHSSPNCSPAVETQIDGDFNGWDDEVIYKMANGEIWQQRNYHYHYHYTYEPRVIIYPTSTGCHIKVDGDDDEGVDVLRIK